MRNSNTTGTNRHGIPLRGGGKPQCIWRQCPNPVDSYPETRLCNQHAAIVHDVVKREREKHDIELEQRIARAAIENQAGIRAQSPTTEPELTEVIYYLRIGGHIKIGWTSQLEKRMRQYPPDSQLLAVQAGSRSDEHQLHKKFAIHRSHGNEWYPLVPAILEHIDQIVRENGEPRSVTFGARRAQPPQPRSKQYVQMRRRSGGTGFKAS